MKNKFARTASFLAIVFFTAGLASYFINSAARTGAEEKTAAKAKGDDAYKQLELFGKAFEITRARYVDDVSAKDLIEGAIDGMLSKRDPHSGFLNEESFREMNEQTSGAFGGLGIEVTMDKGVVKVISPIDDTPAFKAGVEAGDLITHIDGAQVHGLSLQDAIKKMKGKPGTTVVLKIFREGKEPFDVSIVRDIIKVDAVKYRVKNESVGYLRLSTFNEHTYSEMTAAIKKIMKENPKIVGFVLDLRNNSGGLLDQAVRVSDAFISQGEIVSIISRQESSSRVFFASEGDILDGMPMVVLINGGSASASEIVAGALKDHRRAVVMGTKSYGKGSVQTLIPMGDAALKITTARYYTPSGRSIQAEGIEPDVEVGRAKIDEIKDERIFAEDTLVNALKNDAKDKNAKAKEDKKKTEDTRDNADYQLQRAVDMVRGLAVYSGRNAAPAAAKAEPPNPAEQKAKK
ncbi:MAG: S41 family peptidase [Rickettsiales bacterium]|jgi:carboxyl-terminal processing protease|nr:S41 family peptidase [Rickettsiales bacterium]